MLLFKSTKPRYEKVVALLCLYFVVSLPINRENNRFIGRNRISEMLPRTSQFLTLYEDLLFPFKSFIWKLLARNQASLFLYVTETTINKLRTILGPCSGRSALSYISVWVKVCQCWSLRILNSNGSAFIRSFSQLRKTQPSFVIKKKITFLWSKSCEKSLWKGDVVNTER